MGRRGPKGSSRELKLLRGERHKDRLAKDKIKPSKQAFKMPAWLSPGAKSEWRRLSPEMKNLGLLTALDRAAFSCYCETFSQYVSLVKDINKNGMVYKTQKNFNRARPQLEMMFRAMQQLLTFCKEFGMTPASRARVDIKIEKVGIWDNENEDLDPDFDW